jgi:hypothetical protein
MSIEQRIKYHKYFLVSNTCPIEIITLSEMLCEKLQIPKSKTELYKKTFAYSGLNVLFSMWQASSDNAFKAKIKNLISNDDAP